MHSTSYNFRSKWTLKLQYFRKCEFSCFKSILERLNSVTVMISIFFYLFPHLVSKYILSTQFNNKQRKRDNSSICKKNKNKANVFPQDVLTRAHTSQFVEETLLDLKIHHHLIQSLDSCPLFLPGKVERTVIIGFYSGASES